MAGYKSRAGAGHPCHHLGIFKNDATEERVERTEQCLIPLLGHLEPVVITAKIYLWTSHLHESNIFVSKPVCFEILSLANQNVPAGMVVKGVFVCFVLFFKFVFERE